MKYTSIDGFFNLFLLKRSPFSPLALFPIIGLEGFECTSDSMVIAVVLPPGDVFNVSRGGGGGFFLY